MIPKLQGTNVLDWVQRFIAWAELGGLGATATADGVSPSYEPGQFRPGDMLVWAGTSIPDGWVEATGLLVFINAAEDLYNEIGLKFDAAPPTGMFRLPGSPVVLAAGYKWIVKL